MSSKVILVQGTSIKISKEEAVSTSPSGLTFETLDCTGREIQWQGGQATENDVTTLCSTAKEFRLGLTDAGTMTVNGHWVSGDAAQKIIKAADRDKKPRLIEVVFEDGSIFSSLALVSQRSWSAAVDGVLSATFNFRLTGEPREDDGTPITSVVVMPSTVSIDVGDSEQLSASVLPEDADQEVVWFSDEPQYATVSPTGLVTGVSEGEATITATSIADGTKAGACVVTVS